MLYYPFRNSLATLCAVLGTAAITSSSAVAQTTANSEPSASNIPSGTYSRGVQQLQIAQRDGNICLYGLPDAEVQAQEAEAIEKIRNEAAEAETQLQARLQQDLNDRQEQIQVLLQDESRLNVTLEESQLSAEQIQQVQRFRENPQSIEPFLEQQANEAKQQLQIGIEQQRIEAEETIRLAAGNLVIQGVASLDLAYLDLNAYTVNSTDLVILPQADGSLVLGTPDKLQAFDFSEDVSLPENLSFQQCLDSQQPYSQLTMP